MIFLPLRPSKFAKLAAWRVAALLFGLMSASVSGLAQAPAMPADGNSQPAAAASQLSPELDLLSRTRKRVQEYFEQFSNLTCKESVIRFTAKTPHTTTNLRPATKTVPGNSWKRGRRATRHFAIRRGHCW